MNIENTPIQIQPAAKDLRDPQPCRIFLVEDDVDDRILAKRELSQSEHVGSVENFGDGKDLIDYMYEHGFMDQSVMLYKPILILVDIEMPRKSGLDVIREIKSDPFLQAIPLVVVTGTESRHKILEAKRLGASGVFNSFKHEGFGNLLFHGIILLRSNPQTPKSIVMFPLNRDHEKSPL